MFKYFATIFKVKPMCDDQSKDEMVKKFADKMQKGYVRGEMQDTSTKKTAEKKPSPISLQGLSFLFFIAIYFPPGIHCQYIGKPSSRWRQ